MSLEVYSIPAYRDATHHPGAYGLAVASARKVWAAGYWIDPLDGLKHPATFRWNGRSWRLVSTPNSGAIAASGRRAWLVGRRHGRAWTARWNGRRWRVVPNPGGTRSFLESAAIVSARDVWTVGSGRTGPLLLRWNGKRWARAAGPDFGGADGSYLAVARIPGTSSVWIFGIDGKTAGGLAARWTSSGWETYSLPTSGTGQVSRRCRWRPAQPRVPGSVSACKTPAARCGRGCSTGTAQVGRRCRRRIRVAMGRSPA